MTIGRHHGIYGHQAHHGVHSFHGHGSHHGIHGYHGHHGPQGLHGYHGHHNQHGNIHHGYQGHQNHTTVNVTSQTATMSPKDAKRRCILVAVIPVFVGVIFIIFGALNVSGAMGSEGIGISLLICGSVSLVTTALMFSVVFFRIWKLQSSQNTETSRMENGSFPPPSGSAYPPTGTDNPSFSSSYPTFGSPYSQHGSNYPPTGIVNPAFGQAYPSADQAYPSPESAYPSPGSAYYPSPGSAYPSPGSAYPPSYSSLPPYPYPPSQPFQLPSASSDAGHVEDSAKANSLS